MTMPGYKNYSRNLCNFSIINCYYLLSVISRNYCRKSFLYLMSPKRWNEDLLKHLASFSGGSMVRNHPASAGDVGSISGSGRSLGEGNGSPLQYSCLETSTDRGAGQATVHGVTEESDMT